MRKGEYSVFFSTHGQLVPNAGFPPVPQSTRPFFRRRVKSPHPEQKHPARPRNQKIRHTRLPALARATLRC